MAKTRNSDDPRKPTRKAGRHLRVPVLPDEEAEIKRLAASVGLPVAAYLRNVGLGYQVPGILDNKRVEELARINGDLGRLGGLLKLWLTDDVRDDHPRPVVEDRIHAGPHARGHAGGCHSKGEAMSPLAAKNCGGRP